MCFGVSSSFAFTVTIYWLVFSSCSLPLLSRFGTRDNIRIGFNPQTRNRIPNRQKGDQQSIASIEGRGESEGLFKSALGRIKNSCEAKHEPARLSTRNDGAVLCACVRGLYWNGLVSGGGMALCDHGGHGGHGRGRGRVRERSSGRALSERNANRIRFNR